MHPSAGVYALCWLSLVVYKSRRRSAQGQVSLSVYFDLFQSYSVPYINLSLRESQSRNPRFFGGRRQTSGFLCVRFVPILLRLGLYLTKHMLPHCPPPTSLSLPLSLLHPTTLRWAAKACYRVINRRGTPYKQHRLPSVSEDGAYYGRERDMKSHISVSARKCKISPATLRLQQAAGVQLSPGRADCTERLSICVLETG
ncbi:hypothetical protein VTK56DRAFT_8075 [Thermocarpiscus australiensis]